MPQIFALDLVRVPAVLLILLPIFLTSTNADCLSGCPDTFINNGVCDAACSNDVCNFDGLDCCVALCFRFSLGNGVCDSECNNQACGFDLGDCVGTAPFCSLATGGSCNIKDINNGLCDQECNVDECSHDGGDCGGAIIITPDFTLLGLGLAASIGLLCCFILLGTCIPILVIVALIRCAANNSAQRGNVVYYQTPAMVSSPATTVLQPHGQATAYPAYTYQISNTYAAKPLQPVQSSPRMKNYAYGDANVEMAEIVDESVKGETAFPNAQQARPPQTSLLLESTKSRNNVEF